jgi:hypothetical protein
MQGRITRQRLSIDDLKMWRVYIFWNENVIHEEIKSIFNSGNACYHSVQNPLSIRLLPKSVTVGIYKMILLVVRFDLRLGL